MTPSPNHTWRTIWFISRKHVLGDFEDFNDKVHDFFMVMFPVTRVINKLILTNN